MLTRIVTIVLLGVASATFGSALDEQALIGRWKSELGGVLTFRRDHTFTNRTAAITITGTWYVRNDRLITTNKSGDGSEEYTNSCQIIPRRNQFSYGMCEHVEKRPGHSPTKPESYTMGVVYHRASHD